mmetsp:Transcript_11326/g.21954  ORF Transcript_11326/g.21954 Transcript_11326/m.21954 type:complete len:258 (+) Transcript_11326:503-1276(+)
MDVRAGHARVHDVADDGHRQVAEVLLEVPDRVHVQQALGRVGMAAVAGVDHVHMRRAVLGDQVGRAALAVTHDEHVGMHRAEVGHRVEQGLALGGGAARDVEVDDVSRQALGRDLEGGAGAGAVLEEQVEHALAAQQRHLLDLAVVDRQEAAGGVQDLLDHRARQALDRQQVDELAVRVELGISLGKHHFTSKEKRPSPARARRRLCPGASVTRAAENAGSMGSWRPPRSTSTASCTRAGRPKSNSSLMTARVVRPV